MPYYHVISEGPFSVQGERETVAAIVYDRPLSFVGKHEFGHRQLLFLGKKRIKFDVQSHDRGNIIALRDVTIYLRQHEEDPDKKIVDISKLPAVLGSQTPGESEIIEVKLKGGQQLPIFKSSFSISGGVRGEQVVWDSNLDGADFFDDLCIAALKGEFNVQQKLTLDTHKQPRV